MAHFLTLFKRLLPRVFALFLILPLILPSPACARSEPRKDTLRVSQPRNSPPTAAGLEETLQSALELKERFPEPVDWQAHPVTSQLKYTNLSWLNRHLAEVRWLGENLPAIARRKHSQRQITAVFLGVGTGEEAAAGWVAMARSMEKMGFSLRGNPDERWHLKFLLVELQPEVMAEAQRRFRGESAFTYAVYPAMRLEDPQVEQKVKAFARDITEEIERDADLIQEGFEWIRGDAVNPAVIGRLKSAQPDLVVSNLNLEFFVDPKSRRRLWTDLMEAQPSVAFMTTAPLIRALVRPSGVVQTIHLERELPLEAPAPAGETYYFKLPSPFVSQDAAVREHLRTEFQAGRLTADEFVDAVLVPFHTAPVPPPELARAGYRPLGVPVDEARIPMLRQFSEGEITRAAKSEPVRQKARAAVEALISRVGGEIVPGRPMLGMSDNVVIEMMLEVLRVSTGTADPYAALKREYNEKALPHLDAMGRVVADSPDPVRTAIALGIVGNAIDFAAVEQRARLEREGFPVEQEIARARDLPFVRDERADFLAALRAHPTGEILFLVDNAGEIVLDLPLIRIFLEQGRPVTVAGKSLPHANDMTAGELRQLFADPRVRDFLGPDRMDSLRVIASGTAMTGLDLRRATPELAESWRRATIVYAKGQGMIETLRYFPLQRDVFHAVMVKNPRYFHEPGPDGAELPLQNGDVLFLRTPARSAGLEEGGEIRMVEWDLRSRPAASATASVLDRLILELVPRLQQLPAGSAGVVRIIPKTLPQAQELMELEIGLAPATHAPAVKERLNPERYPAALLREIRLEVEPNGREFLQIPVLSAGTSSEASGYYSPLRRIWVTPRVHRDFRNGQDPLSGPVGRLVSESTTSAERRSSFQQLIEVLSPRDQESAWVFPLVLPDSSAAERFAKAVGIERERIFPEMKPVELSRRRAVAGPQIVPRSATIEPVPTQPAGPSELVERFTTEETEALLQRYPKLWAPGSAVAWYRRLLNRLELRRAGWTPQGLDAFLKDLQDLETKLEETFPGFPLAAHWVLVSRGDPTYYGSTFSAADGRTALFLNLLSQLSRVAERQLNFASLYSSILLGADPALVRLADPEARDRSLEEILRRELDPRKPDSRNGGSTLLKKWGGWILSGRSADHTWLQFPVFPSLAPVGGGLMPGHGVSRIDQAQRAHLGSTLPSAIQGWFLTNLIHRLNWDTDLRRWLEARYSIALDEVGEFLADSAAVQESVSSEVWEKLGRKGEDRIGNWELRTKLAQQQIDRLRTMIAKGASLLTQLLAEHAQEQWAGGVSLGSQERWQGYARMAARIVAELNRIEASISEIGGKVESGFSRTRGEIHWDVMADNMRSLYGALFQGLKFRRWPTPAPTAGLEEQPGEASKRSGADWLERALQAQGRGDLPTAALYYGLFLQTNPGHGGALNDLAAVWVGMGRLNEAISVYEQLEQSHPEDALILSNLGAVYVMADRMEDGLRILERAVQIDPDDPDAWLNLTAARVALHLHEGAIAAALKTVSLAPRKINWYALGKAYAAAERFSEAADSFRESVRKSPRFLDGWLGLAHSQVFSDDFKGAERSFQKAIRLDRNGWEAWDGFIGAHVKTARVGRERSAGAISSPFLSRTEALLEIWGSLWQQWHAPDRGEGLLPLKRGGFSAEEVAALVTGERIDPAALEQRLLDSDVLRRFRVIGAVLAAVYDASLWADGKIPTPDRALFSLLLLDPARIADDLEERELEKIITRAIETLQPPSPAAESGHSTGLEEGKGFVLVGPVGLFAPRDLPEESYYAVAVGLEETAALIAAGRAPGRIIAVATGLEEAAALAGKGILGDQIVRAWEWPTLQAAKNYAVRLGRKWLAGLSGLQVSVLEVTARSLQGILAQLLEMLPPAWQTARPITAEDAERALDLEA